MKKVLVVEDDVFLSSAYKVKLSKAGYELRMVLDGDEAISILAEFVPDIILLDLIIPGKDGFHVLGEIRKSETLRNIPVIVASNLGQKEDIERAMSLGATDYIIKTDLSMKDVLEKIEKYLQN
jgi:DNA-binding response OmpR family regulator